jgi:hypothetical protein
MRVQVKVCRDTLCWYCPRIVPHVPPNVGFFPFYTVADGDNGWVPVHEQHAELQHEDEEVRALAHDLYVTDNWLPDNCVKRAWRSMPHCSPFRARLIASATNLSEQTVVAMFLKLNEEDACRTDISRACGSGLGVAERHCPARFRRGFGSVRIRRGFRLGCRRRRGAVDVGTTREPDDGHVPALLREEAPAVVYAR